MAIDKVTVNIYTCSKCQHKWLAGWDNENNKERPIPVYCPKCKNIRWDWDRTPQEKELFDAVLDKHQSNNKRKKTISLDIIAINFLYEIRPQPDMFEIKQVLSIPTTEKRHEAMLAIMEDRATKYDKYPVANYDKYSVDRQGRPLSKYANANKAFESWVYERGTERVLIMKGCKHEDRYKAVRQQLKERGLTLLSDHFSA